MYRIVYPHAQIHDLIESYLRGGLPISSLFIKSSVRLMCLLLDRGTKFQQLVWYRLSCSLEHIDQSTRLTFVVVSKESDC